VSSGRIVGYTESGITHPTASPDALEAEVDLSEGQARALEAPKLFGLNQQEEPK
jgi:hypothetical protein